MSTMAKGLGLGVALAAVAATAALSRVPWAFSAEDDAALRLAWRTEGAVMERCQELSEEELARLPVHMRNPRACIGQIAPYVLSIRLDGRNLAEDTVHAAGARGDRPITVLRDLPVSVGTHDLDVSFRALLPEGAEVEEGAVTDLRWSGPVILESRDVALLTLDASGAALELRMP